MTNVLQLFPPTQAPTQTSPIRRPTPVQTAGRQLIGAAAILSTQPDLTRDDLATLHAAQAIAERYVTPTVNERPSA